LLVFSNNRCNGGHKKHSPYNIPSSSNRKKPYKYKDTLIPQSLDTDFNQAGKSGFRL
jgi:hypothetical protein